MFDVHSILLCLLIVASGADYCQFIDIESAMYRGSHHMTTRSLMRELRQQHYFHHVVFEKRRSPRGLYYMYFNVPGVTLLQFAIYDLAANENQL
jgi:hypothetical protein